MECIPNSHWVGDVECFLKPLKNRSIQIQAKIPVIKPINSLKVYRIPFSPANVIILSFSSFMFKSFDGIVDFARTLSISGSTSAI